MARLERLKRDDFLSILSDGLPYDVKRKYDRAFQSLASQTKYCYYHCGEFEKACLSHAKVFEGVSPLSNVSPTGAEQLRIIFEAHAFAFFRCLHALIDSIPYALNIGLEIDVQKSEGFINWNNINTHCKKISFLEGERLIDDLRKSPEYKTLEKLVNISKHRRLPVIESGVFGINKDVVKSVRFYYEDDFEIELCTYGVHDLMHMTFNTLHPKSLQIISAFIRFKLAGLHT